MFYTAWGHDRRTWGHPGFQNLVERGIRWATGHDPAAAPRYSDLALFPIPRSAARRTDVRRSSTWTLARNSQLHDARSGDARRAVEPHAGAAFARRIAQARRRSRAVSRRAVRLGTRGSRQAHRDAMGRARPTLAVRDIRLSQPSAAARAGSDRIRICEDTDGDGKADKFTVFADKLSIPSSVAFSRDGVIVFEAGRTVFLKDVDGDDVADERTPLFGAWSQTDTHGGPSNMQYGLDNWIWGMQGYNRSRLEVGGQSHEFRQGFFRFRPDGSKLEFLRSTDNNTWGLGISEEGIVFGSTANRKPSVYLPIANRYYEAVRGWAPSLTLDRSPTRTCFMPRPTRCGRSIILADTRPPPGSAVHGPAFPQEYRNRTAFVCEPTGHLVGVFVLTAEVPIFAHQSLQSVRQRRRMDCADDGRSWAGRQYLGHRLVQLHRAAQSHADRIRTGKGSAVRNRSARQEARPNLPRGIRRRRWTRRGEPAFTLARHSAKAGRHAQASESIFALARAAAARGA